MRATDRKRRAHRSLPQISAPFVALCLLLCVAFVAGGSARAEVASLMVLRPAAVLLLGFGLLRLRKTHVEAHRGLIALAVAILALPALQLIPLPPGLWSMLPGRQLVSEIDRVAGLGAIWRPFSLAPDMTRNALFSLAVPLGALVLGIQTDPKEHKLLLGVILALCGASAQLGLLQKLGDPSGPLYFYKVTNPGSAVGLFANRNHQALMLAMMFPMLAVLARGSGQGADRGRLLLSAVAGLVLLPLVFITGSRSGLLLSALAIASIPFVLGRELPLESARPATRRVQWLSGPAVYLALGSAVAAMAALSVWAGNAEAWTRLLGSSVSNDDRLQVLPALLAMLGTYALTGSGMGSFAQVYQVAEPDALLSSDYLNHAHNDLIEVLIDGGIAAGLILIAAAVAWLACALRLWSVPGGSSPEVRRGRLGIVLIALAAIASLSDYPLRVPSLAALITLAAVWACCATGKTRPWIVA